MSETLYTFDPKKKRKVKVGYYNSDYKTFIKGCSPEHFMVLENGYGISEDVIKLLKEKGCLKVLKNWLISRLT